VQRDHRVAAVEHAVGPDAHAGVAQRREWPGEVQCRDGLAGQPAGVAGNHEQHQPVVGGRGGDHEVGGAAVDHVAGGAVEHPVVALAARGDARVRGHPPALVEVGEREPQPARRHLRQPLLLLFLGGRELQGGRAEHRRREQRHREETLAGLLDDEREFDEGGAGAAELLGDRQPEQAVLAEFLPGCVVDAGVALHHLTDPPGGSPGGEEVAQHASQLLLFVGLGERDGHGRHRRPPQLRGTSRHATFLSTRGSPGRPSTRSPRMFFMISLVPPSIELARARRNALCGSSVRLAVRSGREKS